MVAKPNIPELNQITEFIFLAKVCKAAEENTRWFFTDKTATEKETFGPDGIEAYIVRDTPMFTESPGPDAILLKDADYDVATQHSNYTPITIRFGSKITDPEHRDYGMHQRQKGKVHPVCGDLTIQVTSTPEQNQEAYEIQRAYFELIQNLWNDSLPNTLSIAEYAECFVEDRMQTFSTSQSNCTTKPDSEFMANIVNSSRAAFDTNIAILIERAANNDSYWGVPEELKEKGWAGAAIWYNRIAELNGNITSAVINIPEVKQYPFIMEYIAGQKNKTLKEVPTLETFSPQGAKITYQQNGDEQIAQVLNEAFLLWQTSIDYGTGTRLGHSPFLETINLLFGSQAMFDMIDNPDVNPLAQLSALGKGMMDSTIINIAGGQAGSFLAKVLGGQTTASGQLVGIGSSFMKNIGYTALVISFILYYILPLLPFIYFFFAVMGWVKSIFEAIVAMPLWALSHIVQWDGEGMAGPAAKNGYMLLLEIFLRPIMILLGLVASVIFFSALVIVLNEVFKITIENLSGGGHSLNGNLSLEDVKGISSMIRGPLDELFYTIVYTILCYMIGMSAFKLVNSIPNTILRWMGFSTEAFQESMQDPAAQLSGQAYRGTTFAGSRLSGVELDSAQAIHI